MATYVLVHGSGSNSWYWHRVAPELSGRGHDVVAPDLPTGDESIRLMVLVAAMVPKPGESPGEWFASTGWAEARREQAERDGREVGDDVDVLTEFFHDVPADVVAEALRRPEPVQAGTPE